MEIENIDDFFNKLSANEIIGIDCCDGSGKTHLSK
jgi:hypothetical protein